MWKRLETSRPDVLIYRRGGTLALLVGLTLAGAGVALFVGSVITRLSRNGLDEKSFSGYLRL
jgi:hypothetical protein